MLVKDKELYKELRTKFLGKYNAEYSCSEDDSFFSEENDDLIAHEKLSNEQKNQIFMVKTETQDANEKSK